MPINTEGLNIDYSTDEDIQELLDGDKEDHCVDVTGYLAEVFGYCKTQKGASFYKAIFTNGFKRMTLLIWDRTIIEKLYADLIPGRILHLDGCHGRIVAPRPSNDLNLINYDITIQPGTVVKCKGFHAHQVVPQPSKVVPTINFIDIAKAIGEIRVKAYVKTVVAISVNKNVKLDFGTGSITEGVHKLPIQVNSFNEEDATPLRKGLCILVQGSVSRKGNLRLFCKDIADIQVLDEPPMSEDRVTKANRLLKRFDPNSAQATSPKKRICNSPVKKMSINDKTHQKS